MADAFSDMSPDALQAPATQGEALTASADAFPATRGIHCNAAGDIVVDFVGGGSGVTLTVAAGQVYPYRITRLTSGTGVVALR